MEQIVEKLRFQMPSLDEIHGVELFHGRKNFNNINIQTRTQIFNDILDITIKYSIPMKYIFIDKVKMQNKYNNPYCPIEWGFTLFSEMFDEYLEQEQDKGLIISDIIDDVKIKKIKTNLKNSQKESIPLPKGKQLKNIIETVHYLDSKESYLLQLSDVITYIIGRKTKGCNYCDKYFDKIKKYVSSKKFP
jgi:hypothetical protein